MFGRFISSNEPIGCRQWCLNFRIFKSTYFIINVSSEDLFLQTLDRIPMSSSRPSVYGTSLISSRGSFDFVQSLMSTTVILRCNVEKKNLFHNRTPVLSGKKIRSDTFCRSVLVQLLTLTKLIGMSLLTSVYAFLCFG